jgi:hypothetical protein
MAKTECERFDADQMGAGGGQVFPLRGLAQTVVLAGRALSVLSLSKPPFNPIKPPFLRSPIFRLCLLAAALYLLIQVFFFVVLCNETPFSR